MKHWLFKFRYPKLALLVIAIVASYFVFKNPNISGFVSSLGNLGYLGVFIAGLFFTFGFSTPFAIGFFLSLNLGNPFLAAAIGGIGAVVGDLVIFNFVKFSFMEEFTRLEHEKLIRKAEIILGKEFHGKFKHYLLILLAGIIISSPLPDELGVSLLAGLTHIKQKWLAVVSFIFNTAGILIFILIT